MYSTLPASRSDLSITVKIVAAAKSLFAPDAFAQKLEVKGV
jgi:hypothetical protein